MAHNEHNRSRNNGGFAMIIFGALLLFLAPNINTSNHELAFIALIGGILIGALGFYLRYIRGRERKV